MSSTSIETLVADYTKTKAEFTEKAKNAIRTAFNEFFQTNPDIGQITWTQYTPYFNGEPCVFGFNEMYFTLAKDKVDLSEIRYTDDDDRCYGSTFWGGKVDPIKDYRAAFKAFEKLINIIPDEIFLNAFDDHVRVIANKDGFDVQEYDHD